MSHEDPDPTTPTVRTGDCTKDTELEVQLTSSGTQHVFRFGVDETAGIVWPKYLEQGQSIHRVSKDGIPGVVAQAVKLEGYTVEVR